jgi:hypothetical protein
MLSEENCQICLHPITNPICNSCYLRQVDNWLYSQKMGAIERGVILSRVKEVLPDDTLNPHQCVACFHENLNICSYCFFFTTARVLRELNFSENFLEGFEEVFSYEKDERDFEEVVNYEKDDWEDS